MSVSRPTPAERMNRMYRYTRHIYDASRRHYLLGRDRLLRRMAGREHRAVLEVGCGTARNLIALHREAPHLALYGVDAAEVMLEKAQRSIDRAGCEPSIRLAQGLAQAFDAHAAFGRADPFDAVFFSYVLSMIPNWKAALDVALAHVKPGGRLYIVDFWDQGDLPRWFAALLRRWLAAFGVKHRPALHEYLHELAASGAATLAIESVARRYAYIAVLQPVDPPAACPAAGGPVNDSITE